MKEKPLSEKIEGHDERYGELTADRDFFWYDDVKQSISNFIEELKEEIVMNDIFTADEIFRIINEKRKKHFGDLK